MALCPECKHPTAAEDCCAETMVVLKRRAEAAEDDWQKAERMLAEADQALAWCYHIAGPFGAKWKADEEYAHVLKAVERHKARIASQPTS